MIEFRTKGLESRTKQAGTFWRGEPQNLCSWGSWPLELGVNEPLWQKTTSFTVIEI